MGRARTIYGALAAVVLLAVGVPILVPSMATLVTLILAKSIVVLGIIILLQAGQVSFGHAMFFAAGAYTAGFWGRYLGVGDLVGYLLVGTVVATLLGLLWVCSWCATARSSSACSTSPSPWCCGRCWRRCSITPTAPTASAFQQQAIWLCLCVPLVQLRIAPYPDSCF